MKTSYKVLLVFLLAVIVGGSGFYYWQRNEASHKAPPSLTLGTDSTFLKAYLDAGNYAEYTDSDVSSWSTTGYQKTANVSSDVHYYYSDEDVSIDNILKSVKPVKGNKVILLFYSPGSENLGAGTTSEGYYSYPDISASVSGGTTVRGISEAQKTSFKVPAYRAFSIILNGTSTEFWNKGGANIYSETSLAEDFGTSGLEGVLNNITSGGWVMIPQKYIDPNDIKPDFVNDDDFKLLAAIWDSGDVVSLYYQDGSNSFKELTSGADLQTVLDASNGYAMLWLKLDNSVVFPQIGDSACSDLIDNDGDGKIDYGTSANNDPGCLSATDTSEVDETPQPQGIKYTVDPSSGKKLDADGGAIDITFTSGISDLTGMNITTKLKKGTTEIPVTVKKGKTSLSVAYPALSAGSYVLTVTDLGVNGTGGGTINITVNYTVDETAPATWLLSCPLDKELRGSGVLGGTEEGKIILNFSKDVKSVDDSGIELRRVPPGLNKFRRVEAGTSAKFKYFYYELDTENDEEYLFKIPKDSITFTDDTKLTKDVLITGLKSVKTTTDQCGSGANTP